MDLTAMIDEHLVKFNFDAQSKNDVIHAGAQLMYESGKINNKENISMPYWNGKKNVQQESGWELQSLTVRMIP